MGIMTIACTPSGGDSPPGAAGYAHRMCSIAKEVAVLEVHRSERATMWARRLDNPWFNLTMTSVFKELAYAPADERFDVLVAGLEEKGVSQFECPELEEIFWTEPGPCKPAASDVRASAYVEASGRLHTLVRGEGIRTHEGDLGAAVERLRQMRTEHGRVRVAVKGEESVYELHNELGYPGYELCADGPEWRALSGD